MRPNFLHQFIHALDLGEQRICKEQIAKDNSKWAKQRNAFLAAMMKLQHYDAEALAATISDPTYLKALPNERHRMYRLLVKTVADHRASLNPAVDPMEKLRESKLMLEIGLPDRALEVISEGVERAMQVEDVMAEQMLREHLRLIYKSLPREANMQDITDNEYRLEMTGQKVVNLIHLHVTCDRLGDHHKRFRASDKGRSRQAVDELMADPLLADISKAISLPAQIRFCNAWSHYYECIGQVKKAEPHLRRALQLWESNPERIAYLPGLYRNSLSNLAAMLTRLGELNDVPDLLQRMEHVPTLSKRDKVAAFCEVEVQYQIFYMNSGRFEEVFAREEQVNAGMLSFGKLIPDSTRLTLYYNIGIAHLVVGNDGPALTVFTRMRDLGELHARLDLQGLARLFRLLLLLERDKDGDFKHFLRNSKPFFRHGHASYRMEELVYEWIKAAQHNFNTLDRHALLMKLHTALTPFEEQKLVGAEELRLWARSRAKGKPIRELFGKKA